MKAPFDISRRRLLQAAGLGAVAATGALSLSACKADPAGGGRGGSFVYAYDFDITAQNFNTIVQNTALLINAPVSELFYPRCAKRNSGTGEWEYQLAESSEWDGDVLRITPRKGVKWSDDSDVTVDDFMGSFAERKLNVAPGVDGWPQVVKFEVDGDAVALTFDKPYTGVEYEIMHTLVHPSSRYGEHFETALKLVADGVVFDDKKQQDYVSQLGELSFDDMVSCGPYVIDADKLSDTKVTMKLHKQGLFGDQVKFKSVMVEKASNDEAAQLMAEKKVDYITHVLGPAERAQLEGTDGLQEFSMVDTQGVGLMLNNKSNPEFADVRVRKAFMHMIKREEVAKIAVGEGGYYLPKYMSGLSDDISETVLSAEELKKFDPYEYDPDKAAEYLKDAGWKKDGDTWKTADGGDAEYEILAVNGWNDFDLAAQQVAEQWNNFGIKVTTKNAEEASIWGIWPAGDWQIAVRQWGNPFTPQVAGAWQMAWFTDNTHTEDEPGMWLDTEKVKTDSYGTVNVKELYDLARTSQDDEERKAANAKLAVVFNETLPRLPVWGINRLSYGIEGVGVKKFNIDKSLLTNDIYQDNPVMISILAGKIEAV